MTNLRCSRHARIMALLLCGAICASDLSSLQGAGRLFMRAVPTGMGKYSRVTNGKPALNPTWSQVPPTEAPWSGWLSVPGPRRCNLGAAA